MVEIPGYRIDEELGSGGMGAVYRGVHLASGERVAIKVITGGVSDPAALERFKREAEVLTRLAHPGILSAREFGVSAGRAFLVTRLIPGDSLHEVVQRAGPLGEGQVGYLGQQLAQALAHAHQRGVLHRDLKPENVVLTTAGQPILIDFGLAKRLHDGGGGKLTESGMVIGTPLFMAPEQALGKRAEGPTTDLYGLGATLFYLLTGKAPFSSQGGPLQVLQRVANDPPRSLRELRPGVGEELAAIVERCMARSPEARYASAFQVAQELGELPLRQPLRSGSLLSGVRALLWPRSSEGLGLRVTALLACGVLAATLTGVFTRPELLSQAPAPVDLPAPRRGSVPRVLVPPQEDVASLREALASLGEGGRPEERLERAVLHAQLGELEPAEELLQGLLAEATQATQAGEPILARGAFAEVLATRGALYQRRQEWLEALRAYDHALSLAAHPDWASARNTCWACLLELPRYRDGRAGEARAHAEFASKLRHYDLKHLAIKEFSRALELKPESQFARYSRAQLYKGIGRYDEALADFTRMVEDHPQVARYRVWRARELKRKGRLKPALDDYTMALHPDAEEPKGIRFPGEPQRHRWYYERALIERELDMKAEAIRDLRKALDLGLEGKDARNAKAHLYELDPPF